jgi:metal-dependent amidase/aminoacylase/carboxypeptidase family protein
VNGASIQSVVSEYNDYIIKMRREFHENPELSGEEYHTREILIRELNEMKVPYRKLPGTGIIATIEGRLPGKNRMLRADIDALPVAEDASNLKQKKQCRRTHSGLS